MKKKIIFFFVVALCFTNTSFSQGLSDANITGTGEGQSVTFANPHGSGDRNVQALIIVGSVDGDPTRFYCVDISRTISFPDICHHDSAVANPQIVYILNNYYPFNPNPVGKLANLNEEVAATQVAIWHYSDNVNVSSVTPVVIRDRAQEIVNDADANGGSTTPFATIQILPAVNPDDFYIKTLDEDGNPIAINGITLSITQGTLSTYTINTSLPSGNSLPIVVTGAAGGTIINAVGSVVIPQGITYTCPGSQRLVLARPVIGERGAQLDWGALPVELSSFNAVIRNRDAILSWSTVSETNNSGFKIEKVSVGSSDWKQVGNVEGNGTSNNSHSYSFTDRNLESGKYLYRLKQVDFNGNYEYHNLSSEIEIGNPVKFGLSQNYPNPFNPSTKINYDLPVEGLTLLKVYNMAGKEVATLVNESVTAGYHTVTFDASNLPSGVYYYKLESNGFSKVMKMALVK